MHHSVWKLLIMSHLNFLNFGIFIELLFTWSISLARFARYVECDFFSDFQTLCVCERSICRDWPHVELRSLEAEHDLHAPQDLKVVIENQIGMQTFSLVRWQLLIATPNHWILRPQKNPSFTASVSLQVKCILTFARGHSFWSKIDLNHA